LPISRSSAVTNRRIRKDTSSVEREERDEFDAAPRAAFDGRADRIDAARMTGDARQTPLGRPSAIAVHDDRDVTRDSRDIGHGNGGAGIGHGR